jgi:ABC-type bacteriocin/lantibiotic exporter with double-glycine peptidase domain
MLCFLLVVAQRIVNLLVPEKLGNIVDCLAHPEMGSPWTSIIIYVFLRFLQGSLLGAARSKLWIHVSQSSYRELSVAAFEHALNLGPEVYLHKRTDILYALRKGATSINKFLEQMTFSMVPMLVDLAMAIGYFLVRFDTYHALVIAIVAFWYMYLTVRMAPWCAENRREMVNADRKEEAVK